MKNPIVVSRFQTFGETKPDLGFSPKNCKSPIISPLSFHLCSIRVSSVAELSVALWTEHFCVKLCENQQIAKRVVQWLFCTEKLQRQ